jgi:methanogenic corrinoid protein MtbC1
MGKKAGSPGITIRMAAREAGLTEHAVRAWERRYGAIRPARSTGHQRQYGPEEVERLKLLATLVKQGHRIGTLARLPLPDLRGMAAGESDRPPVTRRQRPAGEWIAEAWEAVRAADARGLAAVLEEARVSLCLPVWLEQVVEPLVRRIGEAWRAGEIRILHEHTATPVFRAALLRATTSPFPCPRAPVLLSVTPPGQWHELGALMAAAVAADEGWRAIYLGAQLPAEEIVAAARLHGARAVAVSVAVASGGGAEDVAVLARLLPPRMHLWIGGAAAVEFCSGLDRARAIRSLPELRRQLKRAG